MKTHRPKTAPRIFLLTVPHTGTNTMIYALAHLGCLPVKWMHFEPQNQPLLALMTGHKKEDDIILTTWRGTEETVESHVRREKSAKFVRDCIALRDEWLPRIHEGRDLLTFNFHKGAQESYRNQAVMALFKMIDDSIPGPLQDYMAYWDAKNAYGQDHNRGFTYYENKRVQDLLIHNKISEKHL